VGRKPELTLLVVCSGNICRSPMVAEILRHRAGERGLDHLVVESAGTLGLSGQPASPEAVAALAEIGIDLSHHRSRGLAAADLQRASLVLVMTRGHLDELALRYPRPAVPRRLLRAFERGSTPDPEPPDLADPIGHPIEVYRQQRALIQTSVAHLLDYLERR